MMHAFWSRRVPTTYLQVIILFITWLADTYSLHCLTEAQQKPLQMTSNLALLAGDVVSFRTVSQCNIKHITKRMNISVASHCVTTDASSPHTPSTSPAEPRCVLGGLHGTPHQGQQPRRRVHHRPHLCLNHTGSLHPVHGCSGRGY